jgi:hypothetical protein
MIARSEHAQRNESLRTVRDFDVRGQGRQSNWAAQQLGRLFQSVGTLMTRTDDRITREPSAVRPAPVRSTAATENC